MAYRVLCWAVCTIVLALLFHVAATYTSTTVIDVGERPAATFLKNFWEAERSPQESGDFSY